MLSCLICESPLKLSNEGYICQNCGKAYFERGGIFQFSDGCINSNEYFPDDAFEALYKSEEKNFWFRVRNKIIKDAVAKYLTSRSRILEVGCGTGYVSRYLKKIGYHVECADLFVKALQFCKKRNAGDRYYQYNLENRLFIEEFEGICAFDVLEHIDDDTTILKNIHTALKAGGILFVTVPADKRLWSGMDIYAEHKRRYSAHELQVKIEGNGFKVLQMSYFMTFLYPFILLSRKLSVRAGNMNDEDIKKQIKKEVRGELQPNSILNELFFLVFSIEVPLIRLFSLPFGSSLLCVAVKETNT